LIFPLPFFIIAKNRRFVLRLRLRMEEKPNSLSRAGRRFDDDRIQKPRKRGLL
jgi:hypothetical protein